MYYGKKIVVCLPAYNASRTLAQTYREIPCPIVDDVVLVDDASTDETVMLAASLGIKHIIRHDRNKGYGANQKTGYRKALELGADIIVMLHPDYQYTPKLIPAMVSLIATGVFPVVLGPRILGKGAVQNGMPVYKYAANRLLTFVQNLLCGQKLSEYHTGYRAYATEVLQRVNFETNSNDFVFDNQLLAQILYTGFAVGEIACPARYAPESSSINFRRSVVYGLGVLQTALLYRLAKWKLLNSKLFQNPIPR